MSNTTAYPGPVAALADNSSAASALQAFMANLYPSGPIPQLSMSGGVVTAPTGNVIAFVQIWGRGFILPYPSNQATSAMATGSAAGCACTDGGCSLREFTFGGVKTYVCEGSCKGTCTLSTSVASGGGTQITYSATCGSKRLRFLYMQWYRPVLANSFEHAKWLSRRMLRGLYGLSHGAIAG